MSIYKFRILLEGSEEVFRDIEIRSTQNFYDLHEIIVATYGFDNSQMAAFYLSNETWDKGQEINLFDMKLGEDVEEKVLIMADTIIHSKINCVSCHLLYTYDFLNMHNFFIELIQIKVKEDAKAFYPRVVYSQGEIPKQENKADLTEDELANQLLKDAGFTEDGNDEGDIFDGFEDFDDYR